MGVVWTSLNIDPKHINPELTTSEPYVMGSHATCSGAWASGPEDYAPSEYEWGYNRMMTVDGLFGAGDTIGGTAHKFSSGSFTEGRIAAKAAVRYVSDLGKNQPQVSEQEYRDLEKLIFQPMENYRNGEGTGPPHHRLTRLDSSARSLGSGGTRLPQDPGAVSATAPSITVRTSGARSGGSASSVTAAARPRGDIFFAVFARISVNFARSYWPCVETKSAR